MQKVMLNRGFVTNVSDEDYERVSQFRWTVLIKKRKGETVGIYAMRSFKKSDRPNHRGILLLHRFIMDIFDSSISVDHRDGDGLNNTRDNLRITTQHFNCGNSKKHKNKTSLFKGVFLDRTIGKWKASITPHRKEIRLGVFDIETEAALAYDKAAREIFGEYACLNFPASCEQSAIPSKELMGPNPRPEDRP